MQMGQQPAMAIGPAAAMGKGEFAPERERRKRRLGFARQWPFGKARPAERQFGRLDSHQADLAAVVQYQRVAVDDLLDDAGAGELKTAGDLRRRLMAAGEDEEEDQEMDEQARHPPIVTPGTRAEGRGISAFAKSRR